MSRFVESKQGGLPATLSAAGVDVEAFPVGFVDERRKGDNLELKVRWKGWGSKDDQPRMFPPQPQRITDSFKMMNQNHHESPHFC